MLTCYHLLKTDRRIFHSINRDNVWLIDRKETSSADEMCNDQAWVFVVAKNIAIHRPRVGSGLLGSPLLVSTLDKRLRVKTSWVNKPALVKREIKKTFSFGHCPNKGGGGLPMPELFGPLFRSAFLVNKKSLFLQKCQWGSVARRLGQMPSILLQGDNNQLPLLQGDTAHTNFFYFSFKGTHTNYLYYSFKGTHRAHTLTFSTSLQWGTHQTTSTSTILPILILLLLLFLSL